MPSVPAISGWALDRAVEFDSHYPGFAGSYLRASDERKHVIAAYMSMASILRASSDSPYRTHAGQAEFLTTARHRDILAAAYGTCPAGLRGALARSGPQPHSRQFYVRLYRMLSAPSHPRLPIAVQQATALNADKLTIIRLLPADLCYPGLVEQLRDEKTANDLIALVSLLVTNGVDRRTLCSTLSRITSSSDLGKILARWATRIELPVCPVGQDDRLYPVRNGQDLRRLAVKYRNCARRYLICTLDGTSSFLEYRYADRGAVVHLQRHHDTWIVEDIYGPRNCEVADVVRRDVLQRMERHGIRPEERTINAETKWSSLRRLTSREHYLW